MAVLIHTVSYNLGASFNWFLLNGLKFKKKKKKVST